MDEEESGRSSRATGRAGALHRLLRPFDGFFSVEITDHGVLVRWKGRTPDELPRLVVESGLTPNLVTVVPSEHSRTAYLEEKAAMEHVLDGLPWVCIGPCVDGRTIEVELLDEGVEEARRRLGQRRSTFDYAVSPSETGYPRAF